MDEATWLRGELHAERALRQKAQAEVMTLKLEVRILRAATTHEGPEILDWQAEHTETLRRLKDHSP